MKLPSSGLPRLLHGKVMHRRLKPVDHHFVYPVFTCLIPLDAPERISNRVFSLNRFNLFSFHFADHGARDGTSPAAWMRDRLREAGLPADGAIWLQCFPRVLGYVFNPVSFWYCHDRDGALIAVLAEVSNTFGERHSYLLHHPDGRPLADDEWLRASKVFHVSPFCEVRGHYRFRFSLADQALSVHIDYADEAGDVLLTAVTGRPAPWTTAALLRAFVAYPWLTVGVMVRIHWQAAKLWLKRVPFFTKPEPPLQELSK